MMIPLVVRGDTVGALTFLSGARRYTEQDLAAAVGLADRAALAIDNARLFREAEERGHAARVLATVGDGVFLVDSRGDVRLWNPAAEAITGLAASELVGRPAAEAIPGWDRIAELAPVPDKRGPGKSRAETLPLDIDGRELWLSISGVGFSDGTVYAFRDLTDERRVEQLKTEFVATASHKLRTPLAAVYRAAMTLAARTSEATPPSKPGCSRSSPRSPTDWRARSTTSSGRASSKAGSSRCRSRASTLPEVQLRSSRPCEPSFQRASRSTFANLALSRLSPATRTRCARY